jgi:iron complex outermembrane receptor protein
MEALNLGGITVFKDSRLTALVAAAILVLAVPAVHAQSVAQFDLPSQPMAIALRAVGSLTRTNVLFDPPLVEGLKAPALKAELTTEQAFARLLAGSGLRYRFLDDKTVMVISASAPPVKPMSQVPWPISPTPLRWIRPPSLWEV